MTVVIINTSNSHYKKASWVQRATFESGDLSEFDSSVGTGIEASTDAKHAGAYGMAVAITNTNDRYGLWGDKVSAEQRVIVEWQFNRNDLAMGVGESSRLVTITNGSGEAVARCVSILMQNTAGTLYFKMTSFDDGSGQDNDLVAMDTGWLKLRLEWKASSGADDGYAKLYIADSLVAEQTGLDNNLYEASGIMVGAHTGVDANTSGTIYYDDVKWMR